MTAMSASYQLQRPTDGISLDWQDEAACRTVPRRAIFHTYEIRSTQDRLDVLEAKVICSECPVRQTCRDYALDTKQYGIWGGTTEQDRKRIKRQRQRPA